MLPFDDLPLHIGDQLRIVCPDLPELCVERTVGTDGTIDVPRVGAFAAAVRRPSEVARVIQAALPLQDRPRLVTLIVLGSAKNEVKISGAVERPLRLYAPYGIGRDRLLAAARPLKEADLSLAPLPTRIRSGSSIEISSVTAARKIEILGGVKTPQTLPPSENLTLGGALEAVGGLSGHGDASGIVVVRNGEPIPLSVPSDVGFPLRPGDLVRVGLVSERHYVMVKGKVRQPGAVEFSRGMTLSKALAAVGGTNNDLKGGVIVWQTGAKTYRLSLPFLLERRIPDPVLGPEDTIIVEDGKP